MRRSLTLHLLAWALGALALVWSAFMVAGYLTGIHEADELTDGHLANVAFLLLSQRGGAFVTGTPGGATSERADLRAHDYQQSLSVVIWDAQGQVLTRTGDAPAPAFTAEQGFATLHLGEPPVAWRTFSRWDPAGHSRKVMAMVSVPERDDLAWDIAGQLAAPGMWLLPVVALALGLAIRRGLRPLFDLSRDVHSLDVNALGAGTALPLRRAHPYQEFQAVINSINTLSLRYQSALSREREVASEFAHELRTPLASLTLHARSLRAGPAEEHALALLRIEQGARRASAVLDELLALARASRTEMAEAAVPLDLNVLARDITADYAQAALDGGQELALVAGGTFVVSGHAMLLEMALRNLIENALAHTPPGTLVEVQLDSARQWLQVCDNGARGHATGHLETPSAHVDTLDGAPAGALNALGLGLGHRVIDKVAAIHGARFERVAPGGGFTTVFRLSFGDARPPSASMVS